MERRWLGLECRAEGRRLSGTVLRYGDISPTHRERFEPGSLRMDEAITLNLGHDPMKAVAFMPNGGLELTDGREELRMSALVPPTPAGALALASVENRRLPGLSIEFKATAETRQDGIRVIEAATLSGIGLVRSPSYPASQVEARRQRFIAARMPVNTPLTCDCIGDACKYVEFTKAAMTVLADEMNEMLAEAQALAFEDLAEDALAAQAGRRFADILLISGRGMENAVASVRRGTLTASVDDDGALLVEASGEDIPKGLSDMAEGAPVFVRPIIDEEGSDFTDIDGVRKYTRVAVRAFLAKPVAGNVEGWKPATVERGERRRERRFRAWM